MSSLDGRDPGTEEGKGTMPEDNNGNTIDELQLMVDAAQLSYELELYALGYCVAFACPQPYAPGAVYCLHHWAVTTPPCGFELPHANGCECADCE